jgi:HEAT repeat protein
MMDMITLPRKKLATKLRVYNEELRAACMMGLSLMKYEPAGGVLLKILRDAAAPDDLRACAACALGKLGSREVRCGKERVELCGEFLRLLSSNTKVWKLKVSAVMALTALGPSKEIPAEKVVECLARVYVREKHAAVRSFLLLGLGDFSRGDRARERSMRLIRGALRIEGDHRALAFACLAAGLAGDRESARTLNHILKRAQDPDLRSAAAVGLGLLKDMESTGDLLAVLLGRGPGTLKRYCCVGLGLMGSKENVEALRVLKRVLANDKKPLQQSTAAMALMLLGDGDAVKVLLKRAEKRNAFVKSTIVLSIGTFRDLQTLAPLIKLFVKEEGVDDPLRAIIITAMGYIVDPAETPVLKKFVTNYNYLLGRYGGLLQIVRLL